VVLSEFASVRPSGLIAINLDDDDELGWVRLTHGNEDIVVVTEKGKALRFAEDTIRPVGRQAAGVIGIRLARGDRVTTMEVVEPGADLLVVTTKGIGKRTPLSEYVPKGRATQGVLTIDKHALKSIGNIAAAKVVQEADDLTIISSNGVVIRTKVKNISQAGRATRGVHVMDLQAGDSVASLARISEEILQRVGVGEDEKDGDQPGEGDGEVGKSE